MLDLVRRIGSEFGISILMSSHLLTEIERVCDYLVLIEGGRLIRSDTLSTFTARRQDRKIPAIIPMRRCFWSTAPRAAVCVESRVRREAMPAVFCRAPALRCRSRSALSRFRSTHRPQRRRRGISTGRIRSTCRLTTTMSDFRSAV
jgi:ABC-type glutathione transport system ATPase component